MSARLELAGVEQHHPAADHREGMIELEIVEDGTLGDYVLKQGPQVWDVPLAVAQLVDEAALGLPGWAWIAIMTALGWWLVTMFYRQSVKVTGF